MIIRVEIPNLNRFISALDRSPTIIGKYINNGIHQSISTIRERARSVTPVDTGELKKDSNWRESFRNFYGELEPMATSPRGNKYAYWVETGHQTYAGMPFLQSGVDGSTSEIKTIFEKELNNAMNEIAQQSK